MNATKFVAAMAATAALGMASASGAAAQACFGTPTLEGQRAISAGVGFPEAGANYHARLDVNRAGPLSYQASFSHQSMDAVDGSANSVGAGVAYQLIAPVVTGSPAIQGCPFVGASYTFGNGDLDQDRLDVPLGFGLGTRVYLGANTSLAPYVQPQFVISRVSTDTAEGRSTTSDHGFGATVGSAVDFGPFYTALDYTTTRWNDVPATESRWGVRLGVKF